MASESDLRHAISMRPSPFHLHPHPPPSPHGHAHHPVHPTPHGAPSDPARSESQVHLHPTSPDPYGMANRTGTSTAVEPSTPPPADADYDPVLTERLHGRPSTAEAGGDDDDVEGRLPSYTSHNDPFQLASKIKTPGEISQIRANSARRRDGCGPLATKREAWRARKIQGFYERQNENIERLLKPVDDHRRQAKEEQGADKLQYQIAVQGSFVANVLLAALQLYGAASSGSLSLFTTMADALFDPLSNITLILSNRAVNRVDSRRFPSGKARIETAGNIVFCFLMCAVSFIIIVMSARELAEGHDSGDTNTFHLPSVLAVAGAFTTKLVLFLYCYALRNRYSQIRILWEDHRNDLLINGFGILTSVGGSKLRWWIDPAGAIALSCLIVFLWLRTAYSEFQLLIGVAADPAVLQLITYISVTHAPPTVVRAIDTVRAYHSGPRLIVEVDIVMPPDASLRATHDVAEALQTKLESLPDVERAYVHVDYETSHAPEHFLKKEL